MHIIRLCGWVVSRRSHESALKKMKFIPFSLIFSIFNEKYQEAVVVFLGSTDTYQDSCLGEKKENIETDYKLLKPNLMR